MAKKKENLDTVAIEAEKDIATVKETLAAQAKIKIKIQKLRDRGDTFVPVGINGYVVNVPVGETTEVPEQVAELLEMAGYI